VPYTPDQIAQAATDLVTQNDPDADGAAFAARYPNAAQRAFAGPGRPTEMTALVAYLQMLGTLVEFDWRAPDPALLR
jgi:cytochrome c oxidase cbb3-type subunit 2